MILDVNAQKSPVLTIVKAEDNGSRYLDVTLTNDGKKITIGSSDRTVLMALDTADGKTVAAINCTVSDGIVTAELTRELLAFPTQLICEIVVYGTNSEVLTSASFDILVTSRIDSTVIERQTDFSALVTALADVASTSNRIDEVSSRIQPVNLGGTGADNAAEAAHNLKVASLTSNSSFIIAENTDMNTLRTPGTYYAPRSVALTFTNKPDFAEGSFKLFVMEIQGLCVQLAIEVYGNTIWFRGSASANSYSTWRKVLTADTIVSESGTWVPAPETGTISVATAAYVYDGHRVTIGTKFTCDNDVTNNLILSGLPVAVRYKTSGSGVVLGTDETVSVLASDSKLQIKSSSSMAEKIIVASVTYMV